MIRRCQCGEPLAPGEQWCSSRCFYEDEPTARDEDREEFETIEV